MQAAEQVPELLVEYKRRMGKLLVGAPKGLVKELTPTLAASTVSEKQLLALQSTLPVPLPPSFLSYLAGPVVQSGIEWAEIILPSNADLSSIRRYVSSSELWTLELIQIGTGPCGDPLCLDYSAHEEDFEYPVAVIDHDSATDADWQDPVRIRRLKTAEWKSFLHMFRVLCLGEAVEYKSMWHGSPPAT